MRNKKVTLQIAIILFSGFTAITQTVSGQADSVLTLETCIRLSFLNNLKLRQAELETDKSYQEYREALSNGLPQISGNASVEDYFNIPVTMVSGDIFGQPGSMIPVQLGTKYNANAGIQAGQMIFSAAYFTSLQLFRKSCQIHDLNFEKGKEELACHVAQLYYIIQITDRRLALIDSNLVALQKIYACSKQHYTNGFITNIDLDRVSVAISNLETENEYLTSERNQQLNMLKYLTGIDQGQPIILREDTLIHDRQMSLAGLSFSSNTDMLIAEQKTALAKLNLKLVRSEYLPSLTGYAVYSYNAQQEQFDLFSSDDKWYKTSFAGIQLKVPLFEGGRNKSRMKQHKIELEQIIIAQKDLENELHTNYLNALQKLSSGKITVSRLNENALLAKIIFKATNDQYRQGLKSLTDVLNAQTEYNVALLNWLQTVLQVRLSELEIMKMNGEIRSLYR